MNKLYVSVLAVVVLLIVGVAVIGSDYKAAPVTIYDRHVKSDFLVQYVTLDGAAADITISNASPYSEYGFDTSLAGITVNTYSINAVPGHFMSEYASNTLNVYGFQLSEGGSTGVIHIPAGAQSIGIAVTNVDAQITITK